MSTTRADEATARAGSSSSPAPTKRPVGTGRTPNDNTWVGWKYPALTRNPNVNDNVRIDPRPDEDHTPLIIWKQDFGPTANAPRGADESTTDDRT